MTITPEQFMSLSEPDEELDVWVECELHGQMARFCGPCANEQTGPLYSIAASLSTIAESFGAFAGLIEERDELRAKWLRAETLLSEAEKDLAEEKAKSEAVLEIVKPSTSKLANAVREALEPQAVTESVNATPIVTLTDSVTAVDGLHTVSPETHPAVVVPAHDADVEEWRAYAVPFLAGHDVGTLNKSQIRTLLGIPHPSAEGVQA